MNRIPRLLRQDCSPVLRTAPSPTPTLRALPPPRSRLASALLATGLLVAVAWPGQEAAAQVYCVDAAGNPVDPAGTEGSNSVNCGPGAQAVAASGIAVGANARANAENAIAVGTNSQANGEGSLALGLGASTRSVVGNGSHGVAIGTGAGAGQEGIAIGVGASNQTYANGDSAINGFRSIAIGAQAQTVTDEDIAFGSGAVADGRSGYALAAGTRANAVGDSVAIGRDAAATGGSAGETAGSTAVGAQASASAASATAIGQQAAASATDATALGSGAKGRAAAAVAVGKDADAEGEQSTALGTAAHAAGQGSAAIGAGAQALSLNSLAIGSGAVAGHANSLAIGAGSATTVGAQSGYAAAYVGSSDSTGEANLGGRTVSGVAAGAAGTDAVNVDQLKAGVAAANQYTDTQIGAVNTRIDQIDGRVTSIEGDITTIKSDITQIGDRVTNVEGSVAQINQTVSQFDQRVSNVENGASGMFQVSQDRTAPAPRPSGANSAAAGVGAVASGANALAVGNDSRASAAGSTALGNGANASHANSVALGAGSATTIGAQSGYDAAYVGSSRSAGEVNLGNRTISGVAPGSAATDAVNVAQLRSGVSSAVEQANRYTDSRLRGIENDVWTLDRNYRGATASAMAMAGLPQAYQPGKSMLAVGVGGYQNEVGLAVGLSGVTEDGRYVYKAQASGNTVSEWGFSVGAGVQW